MFSSDLRRDLLITALEGGSNYWALIYTPKLLQNPKRLSFSELIWEHIEEGCSFPILDVVNTEDFLGDLNLYQIEIGERILQTEFPVTFKRILDGNWDAEDADVWLQHVVMKELVYG